MNKNWLIRTKSNYIFGPVSKEKIIELYQNGSIHRDDEICCGNSFWFFVREENFIQKYLFENNIDSSEVKSPLKDSFEQTSVHLSREHFQENLSHELAAEQEANEDELIDSSINEEEEISSHEVLMPLKEELPDGPEKKSPSQDLMATWKHFILQIIGIILGIAVVLLLFYRKKIMRLILEEKNPTSFIENILLPSKAYAQENILKKKNQ